MSWLALDGALEDGRLEGLLPSQVDWRRAEAEVDDPLVAGLQSTRGNAGTTTSSRPHKLAVHPSLLGEIDLLAGRDATQGHEGDFVARNACQGEISRQQLGRAGEGPHRDDEAQDCSQFPAVHG